VSIRDMAVARGTARAVWLNYSIRLHQMHPANSNAFWLRS